MPGAVFHLAGIPVQTQFHPAGFTKVHELCRLWPREALRALIAHFIVRLALFDRFIVHLQFVQGEHPCLFVLLAADR
jgi:hypothetical protein